MDKKTKARLLEIFNEELANIMQEAEPSIGISDYATLSQQTLKSANKLSPDVKVNMDNEINYALRRGSTTIDYNLYKKNKDAFNYFTDALATIVKQGRENNENAKRALMEVFSPFSKQGFFTKDGKGEYKKDGIKMSTYYSSVNRMAANHVENQFARNYGELSKKDNPYKFKNNTYFENSESADIILDSFYNGFDKAIVKYNPEQGHFHNFLTFAIANARIDRWRKENQYIEKGEIKNKGKVTNSLDNPLDNDDLDSGTLGDTITSPDTSTDRMMEKNRAKKIWNAIDTFIKRAINFEYPKNPDYEKVYDMYTNHDMDLKEIADALGINEGNVRIMKMRAEDSVKDFIEDGTMAQFVSQVTGEQIKNIPFVQGKGSDKMRFVFPRVKDSLKEGIENQFSNIITLLEGEFIFDTTSFYNESENPDWIEYANFVLQESEIKFTNMSKIYDTLNNSISTLNEAYDGNYNIDVMDLFQQVKGFVEESHRIIRALYDEIYKLENVAYSVRREYPLVTGEIDKVTKPIIEKLEEWPSKLSFMLKLVRQKYNPDATFGIS